MWFLWGEDLPVRDDGDVWFLVLGCTCPVPAARCRRSAAAAGARDALRSGSALLKRRSNPGFARAQRFLSRLGKNSHFLLTVSERPAAPELKLTHEYFVNIG